MEARGSSEAFVPVSQTTRQYFPEDIDLNAECCEGFTLTTFNDCDMTQSSEFSLCKQCAAHEGEPGIKVGSILHPPLTPSMKFYLLDQVDGFKRVLMLCLIH